MGLALASRWPCGISGRTLDTHFDETHPRVNTLTSAPCNAGMQVHKRKASAKSVNAEPTSCPPLQRAGIRWPSCGHPRPGAHPDPRASAATRSCSATPTPSGRRGPPGDSLPLLSSAAGSSLPAAAGNTWRQRARASSERLRAAVMIGKHECSCHLQAGLRPGLYSSIIIIYVHNLP